MLGAIMQPTYLPWIGYFDLIDNVDIFVFYDDVQLVRRSWGVRNRIKDAGGNELLLSVPVKKEGDRKSTLYSNARPDFTQDWVEKHLKVVKHNYARAPFFGDVFPVLEDGLNSRGETIGDLNIGIIERLAKGMGIHTRFLRSSTLGAEGVKDERLVDVCIKCGIDRYLSPQGSAEYIEVEKPGGKFPENDIELLYQNFHHPDYPQMKGEFLSHLSVVDLLFNVGFSNGIDTIRKGRKTAFDSNTFRKQVKKADNSEANASSSLGARE